MLKQIYIDGFKSLSNFRFDIRPGLNVLVGANGSGKTTIIKALEFISNISNNSLSDSIGKSGGTSEIFDTGRVNSENIDPQFLELSFSGSGKEVVFSNGKKKEIYINYFFFARILFDAPKAEVAYTQQELTFSVSKKRNSERPTLVHFAWKPDEFITNTENEENYPNSFGDDFKYMEFFKRNSDQFYMNSIVSSLYFFRSVSLRIMKDVNFGRSFNIIPDQVKKSEDIATPPGINPDGSGLAATLFHAMRTKSVHSDDFIMLDFNAPRYDEKIFNNAVSLLKLVNENIQSIEVTPDFTENKFSLKFTIRGNGSEFKVPLRLLSDGTVKWLAMSVAILSKPEVFILEEPENFLHPRMLYEAVNLMRDTLTETADRFIILSSHSETLINRLSPDEIIVVSFSEGKTTTSRIDNPKRLKTLINKTGFGLGWHFVHNSLETEQ